MNIKNGNVTEAELESARKYISTAIRSKLDSAVGIEDFYLDAAITGIPLTPEDIASSALKITKDNIVEIANNISLDTVHYITSAGGDKDEA